MQSHAASEFPSQLRALLSNHGVTDLGRDLVSKVRAGPPARAVEGAGGNVTGRYPSRKMSRTIQYESRTVEFAFVISCEIDSAITEYYDQPARLSLRYPGTDGRDVVVGHVPDFLVLGDAFAGFVECKDESRLAKLAEQYPLMSLADARRVAAENCPGARSGGDPFAGRKSTSAPPRRAIVEEVIQTRRVGRRNPRIERRWRRFFATWSSRRLVTKQSPEFPALFTNHRRFDGLEV